jgi:hypothetical protein
LGTSERKGHARDDQHDALGTLQDDRGPGPLRVGRGNALVAGPLVELRGALDGAPDDGGDFSRDDFEAWLSEVDGEGLEKGLQILAEQENGLVQLVLAPREGARGPSAEGRP